MGYKKVGNKRYWYRNYRVRKETDEELEKIKKKFNKTWDGTFKELIKKFNNNKKARCSQMTDQEYGVVEKMELYGGSFVKALAICFYKADNINFKKLKNTFPGYWKQYEDM